MYGRENFIFHTLKCLYLLTFLSFLWKMEEKFKINLNYYLQTD